MNSQRLSGIPMETRAVMAAPDFASGGLTVWATHQAPQTASVAPYGPPPAMPPRESPLDILARRFAAGEISADEYQKARDLLKGDSKTS